jgi:transcription initiation factor TFIIH subunit 4
MSSTASQRALNYLEGLPGLVFTRLYQQPSTALAVFRRMLPHLAKTIVMGMLYMPTPVAVKDLESWVKPDSESSRAKMGSRHTCWRLRSQRRSDWP